jgi:plastocyanin
MWTKSGRQSCFVLRGFKCTGLALAISLISACGQSQRPLATEGDRIRERPAHLVQSSRSATTTEPIASDRAPAAQVSIDNFTFHPETIEVRRGTQVVWTNRDDVPHTVRSEADLFRSGTLDTDDIYERIFTEPGTYEYYCGVHRHMTGKIVVK